MKQKDNKKIFLLASFVCALLVSAALAFSVSQIHQGGGARGQFDGYYQRGKITIRAYQIETWQDYQFIAAHEWGHHVYDKYLSRDNLKAWFKACEVCGFQSDYTNTYRSKSTKIYEEWAEMYAAHKTGQGVQPCQEKLAVLVQYE